MKSFHLFIKFGKKEYIRKLYYNGELYLNTLEFYTKQKNKEIGDSWEDVVYTDQIKDFNLECNGQTILKASSGKCQIHISELNQNLFCLWSMNDEYVLKNEKDGTIILNIADFNGFVDDDKELAAVVITNLEAFIEKIKKELNRRQLKYKMDSVIYFDPKTYSGKITPFMKRKEYESQQEFRILVQNTENKPLIINIGNISDIAMLFDKNIQLKMGFSIKHNT